MQVISSVLRARVLYFHRRPLGTPLLDPGTQSFLLLGQIAKGKREWQISCLLVTLIVTWEFNALFVSILLYFLLCSYILLPSYTLALYISTYKLLYTFKTKAVTQKLNSFTSYYFPT